MNGIKGEIPSIIDSFTNASLNAKINEVKSKIPNITELAATTTTTVLIGNENKIPNLSNLVKKSDCNTKINQIEKKLLIMVTVISILRHKYLIS